MQWIEVDTYFTRQEESSEVTDDPDVYFQPRTCMHCEDAPCELVCPVAATVHDAEGLNVMVYNRCVGTRYCGNNCPYKVRHFNFLNYFEIAKPVAQHAEPQAPEQPRRDDPVAGRDGEVHLLHPADQRGPDQRQGEGGHRIKDGDVQTACQAACPAQAIHFGDLNDKKSKVYKIKQERAGLRDARRAEHAAPDDLPRQGPQPQPRTHRGLTRCRRRT